METKISLSRIVFLIVVLSVLACNKEDNINQLGNEFDSSNIVDFGYNHEQLGEFIYHHTKYYLTTVDPYEFLPEEVRDNFKNVFENAIRLREQKGGTYLENLNELESKKVYTANQVAILKAQHEELENLLLHIRPDAEEAWAWMLKREEQVKQNDLLTEAEKVEILNINAIVRHLLHYRLENRQKETFNSSNARTACGFWAKAFCYLGVIKDYVGLASSIVGGVDSLGSQLKVVSSAIGAAVGTYKSFTSCACNTNVCQEFQGISFAYECYSPGDNILFQGWGHGNIPPSTFRYRYYKNNNWSFSSNFHTNVSNSPNDWLTGSVISSNGVSYVGLTTENICSGIPRESDHGMWKLSDLGVPFAVISGENFIPSANANYYPFFNYQIDGIFNNSTTLQWELIPYSYLPYSATGTILGGSNSRVLTVDWDDTPGFATLKCTATTSCSTKVHYYQVHIF